MKIPGLLAMKLAVLSFGVVMVAKLTGKQQCFVDEYLIDLNATQAAIRAGYSERTADRIGPELLGKTCVSAAIHASMAERAKRTKTTQDQVLEELAKVGFDQAADYNDSKLKVGNKLKALELLGKHLGLFDGKGGGGEGGVQIIDDV